MSYRLTLKHLTTLTLLDGTPLMSCGKDTIKYVVDDKTSPDLRLLIDAMLKQTSREDSTGIFYLVGRPEDIPPFCWDSFLVCPEFRGYFHITTEHIQSIRTQYRCYVQNVVVTASEKPVMQSLADIRAHAVETKHPYERSPVMSVPNNEAAVRIIFGLKHRKI